MTDINKFGSDEELAEALGVSMDSPSPEKLIPLFQQVLEGLGEDADREGLLETPSRIAKAWIEMTRGLHLDPSRHLEKQFTTTSDSMVIVKDIPFNSLCEHHFLPFQGKAHIAYIPGPVDEDPYEGNYRIAGLSKFARVVEEFAARPQVQENLTQQVADAIENVLNPQGVMVTMQAGHSCMSLRGVRTSGSETVTSAVRGLFATNDDGVKDEAQRIFYAR